jgi:hypothetical protein
MKKAWITKLNRLDNSLKLLSLILIAIAFGIASVFSLLNAFKTPSPVLSRPASIDTLNIKQQIK